MHVLKRMMGDGPLTYSFIDIYDDIVASVCHSTIYTNVCVSFWGGGGVGAVLYER